MTLLATRATLRATIPLVALLAAPLPALSQGAGPTGWCTDRSGRNFRCGSAPALAPQRSTGSAPGASTPRAVAQALVTEGLSEVRRKNDAGAVAKYQAALRADPSYVLAKDNLGKALGRLGFAAYRRSDYLSAVLYYERAIAAMDGTKPDARKSKDVFVRNIAEIRLKSPSGSAPSCVTCAKALISDLEYGLGASASFRPYANGSWNNYANCRRKTPVSCAGDRGDRLHGNVGRCEREQKQDAGFKSCVRTVVRGARLAPN